MDLVEHKKDYVKLLDVAHRPYNQFLMIQRFGINPDHPPLSIAMTGESMYDPVMMYRFAEVFLQEQENVGPEYFQIWYVNKRDHYYQLIKRAGETEFLYDEPQIKVDPSEWTRPHKFGLKLKSPYESLHPDSPTKNQREMWSEGWKKNNKKVRQQLESQLKIINPKKED
jgi:hypothetical protein